MTGTYKSAVLAIDDVMWAHYYGELEWLHCEQLFVSMLASDYGNPN